MARRVSCVLGDATRRAGSHAGRRPESRAREAHHAPLSPETTMTARSSGDEVLIVRRTIAAPRERVFAAWLDPAKLSRFMQPGDVTHTVAEVDARVGGRFRIVMEHGRGGTEHHGEYLVIDPPSRLSFTWTSANTDDRPTTVTIELE